MPKGIYNRMPGKYPYGPRSLSPKDDIEIARLYIAGETQVALKLKFHTGKCQIRNSLKRTKTSTVGRKGMSGDKNPAWKGGRIVDSDGVRIYCPNHPIAKGTYVSEHRLVMEQALNRYLKPGEVVHHKNKNRHDNCLENLLVFSNNGTHLGVELLGKCPKWTKDGRRRIHERSIPSMKGIHQTPRGSGVRQLRRKLIQEYLHETSDLQNSGLEATHLQLPSPPKRKKT